MGQRLFSLKDVAMAMEINKHKWLESEKAGKDIGLEVAAVDWLHKYSDSWHKYYSQRACGESIFIEKRELRRFELSAYAKIVSGEGLCFGKVVNLSFVGLLCQTVNSFPCGAKARLHLTFGADDKQKLSCIGVAERSYLCVDSNRYEIFFRFSENIWQSMFSLDFLTERIEKL